MKRFMFRTGNVILAWSLACPVMIQAQPVGGGVPQKTPDKTQAGTGTTPPAAATDSPGASTAAPGTSKENKDPLVDAAFDTFKAGKEEEAYKQLLEAAKKNTNLPPPRLMMHRMYMAVNKIPQGRQAIEQAAVEHADHPDIYITFATYALNEARFTDAMLQFEKALSKVQDKTKWNDNQRKNVSLACHSGMSRAAQGRQQWELSKTHLEEALKLDFPKAQLAGFRQELGRVFFMLNKLDDASKTLEQAEKDEPAIDPTGVTMGRLYSTKAAREPKEKQKELFDKAKEWFEYAIKKDPKNFKARISYCVWLFDMDYSDRTYFERAKEELEEAAKLNPKNVDVRLMRGLIHRRTGNFEAAEAEFDSVRQEQPNDFNSTNQLILSLVEQSTNPAKQQRAMQLAEDNYKRHVMRNPEAAATFGWVKLKNTSLDEAERYLSQALQTGQVNADTLYYFAKLLQFRSQLDRAAEILKVAVNSPGRFMYRKDAVQTLDQLSGKAPPGK